MSTNPSTTCGPIIGKIPVDLILLLPVFNYFFKIGICFPFWISQSHCWAKGRRVKGWKRLMSEPVCMPSSVNICCLNDTEASILKQGYQIISWGFNSWSEWQASELILTSGAGFFTFLPWIETRGRVEQQLSSQFRCFTLLLVLCCGVICPRFAITLE